MNKPESRTLAALVEELAVRFPERPAASFEGRTVTFAQFRDLAIEFAKALQAEGVMPGDKVGILMGNRIEWLVVNFAIQYLGATMVALNTWYTARELAYVLDHADISVLVTVDRYLNADYVEMLDGLAPLSETFPRLKRVVMLGDRTAAQAIGYEAFVARGAAVADTVIHTRLSAVQPSDIAYLLYTSGSTSHPKGVLLQHDSLIENTWNIGARLHLDSDDALFLPVSLFWGMGCENLLLTSWTHGVHIVMQQQFDATEALHLISRYRCTALGATPNIVHAIFEHPQRGEYDLSGLRKGVASGSPEVSRKLIATAMPLLCHCYGLTECYGFATVNDASDPVARRAETEGRVLPGTEVRIVCPETGRTLPAGEAGEVCLRGHVMRGYFKNPEATAASFDADGFFHTGDLGVLDAEGFLHFKGRIKEMLKTGGINVAPIEVEEVLRTHPAIEEAFVTGLPDPVRDEVVAAVIVLARGATLDKAAVLEYCRASLAAYKVPREVVFVPMHEIPQTSTRKVHRMRLAELFSKA
ncbi:fatty-acyl-CoA synthase [Paraburkholderia unamae]|uniref:class I adenylate-forming enzyme family protein n=1 Tax=Paraburkholderia unamae TaxID=219649 RepID=UPI000DC47D03|nr:AMP-binding protein [Paraburkholderia unamae]RAR49201.1 fatty-acyl-CoA synthase [Paraburkholderia unamae]